MAFSGAIVVVLLAAHLLLAQAKIYNRCELARELRDVHHIPEHQLATWLCIVNHESHFDTSAYNPGSGDHGMFQISQLFWCSNSGVGLACGLSCSTLKDDNIEDDVRCIKTIYNEHQRLSGDGFTAWVVYNLYCRNNPSHVNSFIEGCFDEENLINNNQYQFEDRFDSSNYTDDQENITESVQYKYETTSRPILYQTTPRRTNQFEYTKRPYYTQRRPDFVIQNSGAYVKPPATIPRYTPYNWRRNDVLYATVNKPSYSFALGSNGFKFTRTVR